MMKLKCERVVFKGIQGHKDVIFTCRENMGQKDVNQITPFKNFPKFDTAVNYTYCITDPEYYACYIPEKKILVDFDQDFCTYYGNMSKGKKDRIIDQALSRLEKSKEVVDKVINNEDNFHLIRLNPYHDIRYKILDDWCANYLIRAIHEAKTRKEIRIFHVPYQASGIENLRYKELFSRSDILSEVFAVPIYYIIDAFHVDHTLCFMDGDTLNIFMRYNSNRSVWIQVRNFQISLDTFTNIEYINKIIKGARTDIKTSGVKVASLKELKEEN